MGAASPPGELTDAVRRMSDALRHRGPDDAGAYADPEAGVALGHRRLSIVDLSPEGHQPMPSASGRYVIAFNGEIYNFPEVRAALESAGAAPAWRGHSDTEVMLAAIERWGVRGALERFNGMFAFALWDRHERVLTLARDRVGEKPLYFGWVGDDFLFASEMKGLYAHPRWRGALDHGALAMYLRFSYVPAPFSVWQGIAKLPAGTFLTLPWGDGAPRRPHRIEPYWSAREVAEAARRDRFTGSDGEAIDGLDAQLREAVRLRMHADVPLGAFLSGGIDSSAVVSLMQAQSPRPVRTFSIGFHESGFDEAKFAKAIAGHLGTDHTELYVDAATARDVIPRLPAIYDEPFGDSSQIPTLLVAELARRHVTVSLSGDGADELFAGYRRHAQGRTVWRALSAVPFPVRSVAARGLQRVPAGLWERVLARGRTASRLRHGVNAAAGYLGARDRFDLYHRFSSAWLHPERLVPGAVEHVAPLAEPALRRGFTDFTEEMAFLDLISYLPGDVLTKVDRATMAVSLEGRMPYLDHHLIEFAWRLPLHLKLRDGVGKWVLRQVLYRYVPRPLIDRPKTGFAVPVGEWLRGPLRDWAEDLLDPHAMRDDAIMDAAPIRAVWAQHLEGRGDQSLRLWPVLMLQAWLRSVPTPAAVG